MNNLTPKNPPKATPPQPTKNFKLLQFETFQEAKKSADKIRALLDAGNCDQLNLAIKEEGNMDNPELLAIDPRVKVFAGAAWFLIHERRVAEGWYK